MSRKKHVGYRGAGFWAYDKALEILLKYLIDRAVEVGNASNLDWLADRVEEWRVVAVVGDLCLALDNEGAFTSEQVEILCRLIDDACDAIGRRESIPAAEMQGWKILDGEGVSPRGDDPEPTGPILEIGRAIQELIRGTFMSPPGNSWWLYGCEGGKQLIEPRY